MGQNQTYCEGLLRRMAESMGFTLVAVPDDQSIIGARWYIAQKRRGYDTKLTATYFSPAVLLDEMLNYYEAFNLYDRGIRSINNPFYGMSPEEAELRLAVMGA